MMEIVEFHGTRNFLLQSLINSAMGTSAPSASAWKPLTLVWSGSMAVSIFLRILAGLPAATWKGGTSYEEWVRNFDNKTSDVKLGRRTFTFVTTLPAPIAQPFPILTPGRTITFPPNQQSSPTWISLPSSGPSVPFRKAGSSGWVPE